MKHALLPALAMSLALVLSGCGKDGSRPKAGATHHLEARVTGTDLTGLDAQLTINEQRDLSQKGKSQQILSEDYATSVSKTIDLGTYGENDLISGEVGLRAAKRGGPVQPRATTHLKLELLADGVVRETTELNESKAGPKVILVPYLRGEIEVETAKL